MSLIITQTRTLIPIYATIKKFVGGIGGGTTDTIIDKAKDVIGIGGSSTTHVPEDDSECKNEGITDEGVIKSAKWKAILNGALLALNTANSLRMAKLQRDLGEKYLELAEEHRKYYKKRYMPLERDLANEALGLPVYKRDKEQLNTGQMLVTTRVARAGAIDQAMSCTGRYCTGQRAAIMNDQLLEQATVESTVAGLAHRYTDKEEMVHNNLRWGKREQVMRIGRDIPTEAVSYASLAGGIFGSLGKQAGKAAEGAMSFLAYKRMDTQYPERRKPLAISTYQYNNTSIKAHEYKREKTYKVPEEPTQTIRIMG